ncbi:hypothetical protein [Paracidovorax anthurii]|uniref:Uncharacterized protein n=1 Tax=Paracidovorax anthurii TaxID=78229 RepID=A0A328ZE94_9BURK|nr:hypothetical protein [Paracidovorax anthurii]RAR83545.1 hypothetical protein AX018_101453 [Paracidovorax anthurii]
MSNGAITRTDLYRQVWETPLSRLAPELGLSDNGLRKLCKRHDIPIPARGYWARAAAGQAVKSTKLPRPDDNELVWEPPTPREAKRRETARAQASLSQSTVREARSAVEVLPTEIRPTLDGCDHLVRNTARFFTALAAKVEKRKTELEKARGRHSGRPQLLFLAPQRTLNGRFAPDEPGCLRIVATLKNIDWILRFHDALIRALKSQGCKVEVREWNRSHLVEIHGSGEQIGLSFAEEFETRVRKDPQRPWDDKEYVAKDTYKLKIERPLGSPKAWVGNQARLAELLSAIARDIAAMLAAQVEVRKVREAEEAERKVAAEKRAEASRVWFAAQKLIADRKAARHAQIDRARAAGKAYDEFLSLRRVVAEMEARVQAETDEAVREWLTLVRGSLSDPIENLMHAIRTEAAGGERPLWWPDADR